MSSHDDFEVTNTPKKPKQVSVTIPKVLPIIVLAVVVAVAGFFAGVHYQKGHDKTTTAAASRFGGQSGGFGSGTGGRSGFSRNRSIGTVSAVSATSITVNDQRSGSSKTYTINSSTTVTNNGATAAVTDIKTGDTVLVAASTSDTTVAAQILLNPSFGGGPGAMGGAPSSSTSQ